jgi:ABC-type phosphate transport system substrate-binding protein
MVSIFQRVGAQRCGACVLTLIFALVAPTAALADVVAVVSARSAVDHLSRKDVADLYLGRTTRFPDGTAALPIDQDEGVAERDAFYTHIVGKSPAQLKAHWSKIIFTGRGKPPMSTPTGLEARKLVAGNPHAIAYLDRGMVDSSVKIVQID